MSTLSCGHLPSQLMSWSFIRDPVRIIIKKEELSLEEIQQLFLNGVADLVSDFQRLEPLFYVVR